uniref:Uncharacterized protein n=1 Tax=viral metagenome TaxID=1070528 RepID=A0A2V0RAM6_9ZZZZ
MTDLSDIMSQMAMETPTQAVDERSDGRFAEMMFVDDKLRSDYKALFMASDNIKRCVSNPNDNSLSLDDRALLSIIGQVELSELEKDLVPAESEILDKIEKGTEDYIKSATSLEKHRERYALLESMSFDKNTKLASTEDRNEVRAIYSDIEDIREEMFSIESKVRNITANIPVMQANVIGLERDLKSIRSEGFKLSSNPRRLLFKHVGGDVSAKYSNMSLADKLGIKKLLQEKVISSLNNLVSGPGLEDGGEIGLFPSHGSLIGSSFDKSFSDFKKTSSARILQQVYEMAVDLERLRTNNLPMREVPEDVSVYDLTNDSIVVTSNSLQREMHLLNLISLAGYSPELWAQAFGVPISGIGKQILGAWGSGHAGPLKAEDLRRLFKSDTKRISYDLDYTTLIDSFKIDEVRTVRKLTTPAKEADINLDATEELEQIAEVFGA